MREIALITNFTFLFLLFITAFPGNLSAQQTDSSSTWLKVLVNLEQYYVVIDDDFKNPHLIQRGDSVRIEPGKRKVTVVWQTISDNNSILFFEPGVTKTQRVYISSFFRSPRSSYDVIINQKNLRITTDPGAAIYIDGVYVGEHVVETLVKPGERVISTKHPEYGRLTKTIQVDTYGVTDFARVNENPSTLSFEAKLIPGVEFIASKRYKRAALTFAGLGILTSNLIRTNARYKDKNDAFEYWELRYKTSDDPSEILHFRENALETEKELQKISRQYNITLAALGAAYLLSTLEAFRKPHSGYRGNSFFENSEFSVVPEHMDNRTFPLLSFQYSFN